MTDRLDPTSLPIFGAPTHSQPPPNGHPVPTITVLPAPPAPSRPAARSLAGPIGTPAQAPFVATAPAAAPILDKVTTRPAGVAPAGVDWQQVAMLRAQASDQLTAALGEERGMDPDTERELGRTIIQELLQTTAADRLHDGESAWSMEEQDAMAVAVYNALFGLGRLGQPAQQALLIAYTFGFEDLSQLLRRQRRSSGNPLGRTQGNIRKKEVAGARIRQLGANR